MSLDIFLSSAENNETHRNWGIIADISTLKKQSQKKQLSQVELKYKGINAIPKYGLSAQYNALKEMSELGQQLIQFIGEEKLKATDLTKFNWIVENNSFL